MPAPTSSENTDDGDVIPRLARLKWDELLTAMTSTYLALGEWLVNPKYIPRLLALVKARSILLGFPFPAHADPAYKQRAALKRKVESSQKKTRKTQTKRDKAAKTLSDIDNQLREDRIRQALHEQRLKWFDVYWALVQYETPGLLCSARDTWACAQSLVALSLEQLQRLRVMANGLLQGMAVVFHNVGKVSGMVSKSDTLRQSMIAHDMLRKGSLITIHCEDTYTARPKNIADELAKTKRSLELKCSDDNVYTLALGHQLERKQNPSGIRIYGRSGVTLVPGSELSPLCHEGTPYPRVQQATVQLFEYPAHVHIMVAHLPRKKKEMLPYLWAILHAVVEHISNGRPVLLVGDFNQPIVLQGTRSTSILFVDEVIKDIKATLKVNEESIQGRIDEAAVKAAVKVAESQKASVAREVPCRFLLTVLHGLATTANEGSVATTTAEDARGAIDFMKWFGPPGFLQRPTVLDGAGLVGPVNEYDDNHVNHFPLGAMFGSKVLAKGP